MNMRGHHVRQADIDQTVPRHHRLPPKLRADQADLEMPPALAFLVTQMAVTVICNG